MAQTLRLLRYGLLLRVGLTLIEAVLSAQQEALYPLVRLTADLPYHAALALVLLIEGRGWQSVRAVSGMLTSIIMLYLCEVFIVTIFTLLTEPGPLHEFSALVLDRMCHRDDGGLLAGRADASAYSTVPIMVSVIPPLLGAWLGGQRSVLRWSGLSICTDLIGRLCVMLALGSTQPLRAQLIDFLTYGIVVTMICAFAGSLAERERAEQRQLRVANRKLAEQAHTQQQLAASRERVRMARDLHDTLAHTLAALTVQLQTVDAAMENPEPEARNLLARAAELADQGLQSARDAIMDLRAMQVTALGLVAALRRRDRCGLV